MLDEKMADARFERNEKKDTVGILVSRMVPEKSQIFMHKKLFSS